MRKISILGFLFAFAILGGAHSASAHVIVTPSTVGIGATQSFSIGVPTEKEIPTTAVRLIIPDGLSEVSSNVKPGWKIDVKKVGDTVTEIDWTGGTIPAEERDDFVFSAQVPATSTALVWKAYQSYADGSVVSWDQVPNGSDDATGDSGPYSQTKVVDDLTSSTGSPWSVSSSNVSLLVSLLALALAGFALTRKKS